MVDYKMYLMIAIISVGLIFVSFLSFLTAKRLDSFVDIIERQDRLIVEQSDLIEKLFKVKQDMDIFMEGYK